MPRIKIISKLSKAFGGVQVPGYNFTGGTPQSVWGQPNYAGAQINGQQQNPQQTQQAPQQPALPQMFNPTGNVPQSSWAWNSQAPTFPVPKNDAIKIDQDYQNKGTPEHNYNTVPLPAKPKKPSNFRKKLNNFNLGLGVAGAATTFVDNTIKQKESNNNLRQGQLSDNYYDVNTATDHGDYDILNGMFRPNQMGFKSKGMYANNMESMSTFGRYGGLIKAAGGGDIADMMSNASNAPIRSSIEMFPLSEIPTSKNSNDSYEPGSLIPMMNKSYSSSSNSHLAHNNPGNIHASEFAEQYGATVGRPDVGGKVAIFPTMDVGLKAMQDLLFKGNGYKNLTISEARKRWVGHEGWKESANDMIRKIGGDKVISTLSPIEKKKLLSEFIRWEDGAVYKELKKDGLLLQNGGENINNSNMKIRIVGGPNGQMANGGEPQYSGQSDYGLYIGQRNLYNTMAKSPYTDPGQSVTEEEPTPDNPYVLEAEGGETILRPDGTHMNITGRRHSEGGEKLTKSQAPEGSFIFSDTARMKLGGKVLENFGKNPNAKQKFTPAELAKQYNVNKYKGILADPNTDIRSKKTASLMIDNYEKKLAELALVQEGKKGFPNGIPDIAKKLLDNLQKGTDNAEANAEEAVEENPSMAYGAFGGSLRKFVPGGPVDKKTFNEKVTSGGYKVDPTNPRSASKKIITESSVKPNIIPGTPGSDAVIKKGIPGQQRTWKPRPPGWSDAKLAAHNATKRKDPNYVGTPDKVITPAVEAKPEQKVCPDPSMVWDEASQSCIQKKETTDIISYDEETVPGTYDNNGGDKIPYSWSNIDTRNVAGSLFGAPKKYLPYEANINVEQQNPTFYDPRFNVATRQATTNNAMNLMGTYGAGQSMGSNASFLAGQQGAGAAGDIKQINEANVGVANTADAANVTLRNAAREFKAKRATSLYNANTIANQQYDNSLKDYVQGAIGSVNAADKNAAYTYNQNLTESPYYYSDPRTYIRQFRSDTAQKNFWNDMKSSGNSTDQAYMDKYRELRKTYGHDDAMDILHGLSGTQRGSVTKRQIGNGPVTQTTKTPIGPSTSKFGGVTYEHPFF
jgi:hypothetical protein